MVSRQRRLTSRLGRPARSHLFSAWRASSFNLTGESSLALGPCAWCPCYGGRALPKILVPSASVRRSQSPRRRCWCCRRGLLPSWVHILGKIVFYPRTLRLAWQYRGGHRVPWCWARLKNPSCPVCSFFAYQSLLSRKLLLTVYFLLHRRHLNCPRRSSRRTSRRP